MENSLKQRVFHALSPPSRPLKVRCQCVETLYLSEGKENQKPVFCLRMFQAVPGHRKFWHGQACQVLLYSFGDRNGGHIHSVFGTHAFFFCVSCNHIQPYRFVLWDHHVQNMLSQFVHFLPEKRDPARCRFYDFTTELARGS